MKKIALTLAILIVITQCSLGQEYIIDSIKSSHFIGLQQSGEMNQFSYVPYFSTNKSEKKNFIIKQLNSHSFTEEQIIGLELPDSYILKKSTFNGMVYFLVFLDELKKEDVIITVQNGNIIKKKTAKHNGGIIIPFSSFGSENFTVVSINDKGNYQIEALNKDMESKWRKSFSASSGSAWDIISLSTGMQGLEIIRKENKAGGKYAFAIQVIQPDNGEELLNKTINKDDLYPYPTFINEREGMKFSGGYFYKNGIYTQQPDGIYFSIIGPDGNMDQEVTVPYSQVIEDVKKSLGSKLMTSNSAIIFTAGTISHESQTYMITGQVITKKDIEGGAKITTGDFVTLKFSFDRQYKEATIVKGNEYTFTLKGDMSKTNLIDLGIWIKQANLLTFKHYVQSHGNPIFAYFDLVENNATNLCFVNAGIMNDTLQPMCTPAIRQIYKAETYTFSGTTVPAYPTLPYSMATQQHDMTHMTTYELFNNQLTIRKMPLPDLEKIRVIILAEPMVPEHIQEDTAGQQPEQ